MRDLIQSAKIAGKVQPILEFFKVANVPSMTEEPEIEEVEIEGKTIYRIIDVFAFDSKEEAQAWIDKKKDAEQVFELLSKIGG